jgi:hypothetical protein
MAYRNSKYIKHNITTTDEFKILEYDVYKNYYSKFYVKNIMLSNVDTLDSTVDIYYTHKQRSAVTKGDLQVLRNAKGKNGLSSETIIYYILKSVVIPPASILVLEQDDIHLDAPNDIAIVTTRRLDVCIEVVNSLDPVYAQNDLYDRKKKTNYTK